MSISIDSMLMSRPGQAVLNIFGSCIVLQSYKKLTDNLNLLMTGLIIFYRIKQDNSVILSETFPATCKKFFSDMNPARW